MTEAAAQAPASRAPMLEETSFVKKRERIGIRVDMTPMVDVAFLLLIFFMVTTVFRQPTAMEVNLPAPGASVSVPESNVLTVFVNQDERLFARTGQEELETLTWNTLRPTFEAGTEANPELIILVKIHPEARYENFVDMMDLLEESGMSRFSLVRMDDDDIQLFEAPE